MSNSFREELLEIMTQIRTIDCHSHTMLKRDYYKNKYNLFNLMSYYERDIHSTTGQGLGQLCANAKSDAERWEIFKSVIERTHNVSYWRHNVTMYREVFDMQEDDVMDSNW
jgi:hypothetical protein